MKEAIEVGKIVTVQGLRGEVRIQPWCDDPSFLTLLPDIGVDELQQRMAIEEARIQKGMLILKFAGVDTVEQAAALRNKVLYVRRDQIPMEEGEYLIQDLLGCTAFDADSGETYGKVCDVSHTGANDVWHIRFVDGSEKLIPVIPQVVLHVDIATQRVEIRPLKGLFD